MSRDESDRLDKIIETLREMREDQIRVQVAVMGDEKAGHLGLVARMNNHARRIGRLEVWLYRIAGGATLISFIVGVVYKVATDWWPRG